MWLLGCDHRQRRGLERGFVAVGVYAMSVAMQWYCVGAGLSPAGPARVITLAIGAAALVFYAAVRSGATARLADPALGMPQTLFATCVLAWAYAHNPSIRGCLLMNETLIIAFGAYALPTRQIRGATAFAFVLFGATMAWKSRVDPARFPAQIEALHFLFAAAVLPAVAFIAGELSSLRARSRAERAELRAALAQIVELATRDPLTGLFNRRHLQSLLDARSRTACAEDPMCAIAIVDLDHFKSVNDRFGHATGDEVLRAAASVLQKHLRAGDIVGRWGGEEFLVLLPGADGIEASAAIERVRERLTATAVTDAALRVLFSAGVTVHHVGEPIARTVERADKALYLAKESGRNRTVVAPAELSAAA